jgi:transposase-like protein
MPQLQLPLFPHGAVHLTPDLAVLRQDATVTYVHGSLPVFRHRADDVQSFRLITSQLYLNGHVRQSEVVRVFGVSPDSVKRAVKLYQTQGPGGFWRPPKRRGPSVLTAEVLARVQAALDAGQELSALAREQQLNASTLNKAVHAGRLHRPAQKKSRPPMPA